MVQCRVMSSGVCADPRPADVDELSLSSEAGSVEDVFPERRERKRKRSQPASKRPGLTDALALRRMLAKPCHKRCKRGCKRHFGQPDGFAKLVEFRESWKGFHKLDQDQIVPMLH